MVEQEQVDKVIELYEESHFANGVCVYKNDEVLDTKAYIISDEGVLYFEFEDEDIDKFQYSLADIEEIKFESSVGVTISVIKLTNGDTIMINNM